MLSTSLKEHIHLTGGGMKHPFGNEKYCNPCRAHRIYHSCLVCNKCTAIVQMSGHSTEKENFLSCKRKLDDVHFLRLLFHHPHTQSIYGYVRNFLETTFHAHEFFAHIVLELSVKL